MRNRIASRVPSTVVPRPAGECQEAASAALTVGGER